MPVRLLPHPDWSKNGFPAYAGETYFSAFISLSNQALEALRMPFLSRLLALLAEISMPDEPDMRLPVFPRYLGNER
jgi:hypothetical protein